VTIVAGARRFCHQINADGVLSVRISADPLKLRPRNGSKRSDKIRIELRAMSTRTWNAASPDNGGL
jgi:hypothetical protein